MSRPDRGEMWLIDLGYVAKTGPSLVLGIPVFDSDRAIVTVIPHTTSPGGTRFEVTAPRPFLPRGVFDAQNPTSITQAKLVRKLGDLEGIQLAQVENAVRTWLGL